MLQRKIMSSIMAIMVIESAEPSSCWLVVSPVNMLVILIGSSG